MHFPGAEVLGSVAVLGFLGCLHSSQRRAAPAPQEHGLRLLWGQEEEKGARVQDAGAISAAGLQQEHWVQLSLGLVAGCRGHPPRIKLSIYVSSEMTSQN